MNHVQTRKFQWYLAWEFFFFFLTENLIIRSRNPDLKKENRGKKNKRTISQWKADQTQEAFRFCLNIKALNSQNKPFFKTSR